MNKHTRAIKGWNKMNAEQFNEALAKIEKERTVIVNLYMQIIAVKEETIKTQQKTIEVQSTTIDKLNKETDKLISRIIEKDNIINELDGARQNQSENNYEKVIAIKDREIEFKLMVVDRLEKEINRLNPQIKEKDNIINAFEAARLKITSINERHRAFTAYDYNEILTGKIK